MNNTTGKENFLKGTISVSLAVILTKIMGVLYKVPLSYLLGDEGMGYFNSAYAIYSFFYILCTSGVPKAITLSVMKYRDSNQSASYNVIRCGLILFLKIGVLIALMSIIFAPAIVNIIGSKKSLYTLLAISPTIIFVSVSGVLRGCLNTYNKLTGLALSQLLEAFLKLILGLSFAFLGYRLRLHISLISAMCVLGITIGSLICMIYLFISYKKIFKNEKIGQSFILDYKETKHNIFKIAIPISLGAAVLNLGSIIDLGVIMRRLSDSGLSESERSALYGNYTTLAVPMFNLVVSLISPIMLAFLPHLVKSVNSKDYNGFHKSIEKMFLANNIIAIPAFLALYFYSFELLDILFSVSSSAIACDLLRTLSVGIVLISLLTVINTVLEAKGKIALTVLSLVIGGIVKAIGNYILIARIGIYGAPVSTVISYAVSLAISLCALRVCGVKIRILRMCIPEIVAGSVFFVFPYAYMYSKGKIHGGMTSAIVCMFLSCSLYFGFILAKNIGVNITKSVKNAQKAK